MNYEEFKAQILKNTFYIEVQATIKDKEKFFKWMSKSYAMFKDDGSELDKLSSGLIGIYLGSKYNA